MHNIILYTIFFGKYIPNNIVILTIVIKKILFFKFYLKFFLKVF